MQQRLQMPQIPEQQVAYSQLQQQQPQQQQELLQDQKEQHAVEDVDANIGDLVPKWIGPGQVVVGSESQHAKRAELIESYRETFSNPYVAAGRRLVDAVIAPSTTRRHLAQVFEYLHTKRELRPPKKHGLMPL